MAHVRQLNSNHTRTNPTDSDRRLVSVSVSLFISIFMAWLLGAAAATVVRKLPVAVSVFHHPVAALCFDFCLATLRVFVSLPPRPVVIVADRKRTISRHSTTGRAGGSGFPFCGAFFSSFFLHFPTKPDGTTTPHAKGLAIFRVSLSGSLGCCWAVFISGVSVLGSRIHLRVFRRRGRMTMATTADVVLSVMVPRCLSLALALFRVEWKNE